MCDSDYVDRLAVAYLRTNFMATTDRTSEEFRLRLQQRLEVALLF